MEPPEQETESRVDELEETVDYLAQKVSELQRHRQEDRQEIERLRAELERHRENSRLADQAEDASRLKVEERAAKLLQTASNKLARDGQDAVAIDHNDADAILGGELSRPQRYDAMKSAAKAVDGDDVEYISEGRSSGRNTRLVVRSNGHEPAIADRFMRGAKNGV